MGPNLTRREFVELATSIQKLRDEDVQDIEIAARLSVSLYRVASIRDIYTYNVGSLLKNKLYEAIHMCTLDLPVAHCTRICKALQNSDVCTVDKFQRMSDEKLLALKGIGPSYLPVLQEVRQYLRKKRKPNI